MNYDRLALERSSYWDSDESRRSYQFREDQPRFLLPDPAPLVDPATCLHNSTMSTARAVSCLLCGVDLKVY